MSMLSNKANYDTDAALQELNQKRLVLDVKVETQTILQLLVSKGLVTREEVAKMRTTVKNSPKYKLIYDSLDALEKKVVEYRNNPEAHLKDLLQAKMDGRLK